MPFEQAGSLRYLHFSSLDLPGFRHAVLTRQGGTSPEPWHSLNLGGSVGDDPTRVLANKKIILQDLGFGENTIFDVWQVHGSTVAFADSHREHGTPQLQADIILTNKPGITLMMRFADCVPVLLFDPQHRSAGLVHAGWQGTVKKAVQTAVLTMSQTYNSDPSSILAAIGPSIGPDHYQVGSEVYLSVKQSFGNEADKHLISINGGVHFDLWQANKWLLEEVGVTKIEVAEICTACHMEDWFSHRGEHGRTGRFGVLAGLEW